MTYSKTTAYKKIKALTKRVRIIQGGTSASKTVSILLYLIASAQCDKSPTLTSVVAESFPHLRRGAMRDFLMIMKEHGYYKEALWDRTNNVYNFETGSQIEFFSVDQPEKVRGARRDRLFINEANNVSKGAFDELEVRTKDFIFIDYNPTNEFWGMEIRNERTDTEFIILTYIDNEALDQSIVDSIEQRRNRTQWWKVYGLGELGEVEGKIYKGWQIIDTIPHEARLERFGLDFGYSSDPSALVAVYYFNGGYIVDELVFQKGLSNKQIADLILNQPRKAMVIADSAEPKSIDEIRSYGVMITPTVKGKDSVRSGIQMVQDQAVSMTKQSINLIKEYRNYLWETDKEGRILNEPEHTWSHSMDAIRYAMNSLIPAIQRRDMIANMPRFEEKEHYNPAR
jgi:phage terminase large subunit